MTRKTVKVQLATPYAPRDSTRTKGGLQKNCYAELARDTLRVVKRPGYINRGPATTSCVTVQGGFVYNNDPAYVACDVLTIGSPSNYCSRTGFHITDTTPSNYATAAAEDPTTGYLWGSDNTNGKVQVYDPVTETVVHTITYPAGATKGAGGICYMGHGKMFVASDGPNGFAAIDYWTIDTSTYTNVDSGTNSTGYNHWHGAPVWLSDIDKVAVFVNNGVDSLGYIPTIYDVSTGVPVAQPFYLPAVADWTLGGPYKLAGIPMVAIHHFRNQITIMTYSNTAGVAYFYDLSQGRHPSSSTTGMFTFDTTRRWLWCQETDSMKLFRIDCSGPSPGPLVYVATLPEMMQNLIYDASRDVLWGRGYNVVVGSPNYSLIYKISAASGAVLSTQHGNAASSQSYDQSFWLYQCNLLDSRNGRYKFDYII